VLCVAESPLSVSELPCQARPVCLWATVRSHNLTMREIVDLTGLADLLDLTRREANELACEENFPAPLDIVQGSQIWYGDDVRSWARESGRLV
jgi:predicted DNA-binding transcriptional regulator AlpA